MLANLKLMDILLMQTLLQGKFNYLIISLSSLDVLKKKLFYQGSFTFAELTDFRRCKANHLLEFA